MTLYINRISVNTHDKKIFIYIYIYMNDDLYVHVYIHTYVKKVSKRPPTLSGIHTFPRKPVCQNYIIISFILVKYNFISSLYRALLYQTDNSEYLSFPSQFYLTAPTSGTFLQTLELIRITPRVVLPANHIFTNFVT